MSQTSFLLSGDLAVTEEGGKMTVLNVGRAKLWGWSPSSYIIALAFISFFSSAASSRTNLADWLCSQLIKFYRSNFEWLDKAECGLDGACGFVTRGAYVPGLGLVECPGELSCQFDCFQYRVTFTFLFFLAFYTTSNFPVFPPCLDLLLNTLLDCHVTSHFFPLYV